jgi:hypothetical protein
MCFCSVQSMLYRNLLFSQGSGIPENMTHPRWLVIRFWTGGSDYIRGMGNWWDLKRKAEKRQQLSYKGFRGRGGFEQKSHRREDHNFQGTSFHLGMCDGESGEMSLGNRGLDMDKFDCWKDLILEEHIRGFLALCGRRWKHIDDFDPISEIQKNWHDSL